MKISTPTPDMSADSVRLFVCAPSVATASGRGRGVTPPRSQFLFLDVRTHLAASESSVFFLASSVVSEARPWLLLTLKVSGQHSQTIHFRHLWLVR